MILTQLMDLPVSLAALAIQYPPRHPSDPTIRLQTPCPAPIQTRPPRDRFQVHPPRRGRRRSSGLQQRLTAGKP